MVLSADQLSIGYRSGKGTEVVQGPVSLQLHEGEFIALLGPNGSGKSTLLRVLAGIDQPISGTVMLGNKPLASLSAPERSLGISLVLTERLTNNFLRVEDLIALGRYPHSGWMGRLSGDDYQKVSEAIRLCNLEELRHRTMDQLSDGERQRAMIARAIAQDTPLIILDEPTAHLDLKTRVEVLFLLRTLARKTNKAIIVATHELELAISLADQVWLMKEKRSFTTGIPEALMMSGTLPEAFTSGHISLDDHTGTFKIIPEIHTRIRIEGEGTRLHWTKKALERNGIGIASDSGELLTVNPGNWIWQGREIHSLKEVLRMVML
ncbi:MAG: ABC transporter ATP-binding protein [Bacteroidota bacterium]